MKSIEADIKRSEGLPMGGMKKPTKSMGNKQATAESAGSTCQESMPNMGTREQTDMPPTSGMGYPCRPTPKPEAVKAVPADQGALKKARMLNERSENGGADPSSFPGK